tara:strand:+ start:14744 stop:15373 length:630 start_codon:yes stop_codon:yes gene_type:complete
MISNLSKIFLILIVLLINSCGKRYETPTGYTSSDLPSTYVWKKGKQYVAVVQTIPLNNRNINKTIHPINISEETIINSFKKIKYTVKKKEGGIIAPKRVFNDRNIGILSKKIPEALKIANKNQDILFEIFELRKKFWIFPSTIDTTAGYLFIEPGRINIIFEKINEDYQGYDYDEPRRIVGNSSDGVYGGKTKVSKGWIVLTSKSWKYN